MTSLLQIPVCTICDRLSKNPTCLHNFRNVFFFLFTQYYLQLPSVVSSFGIIALDSRKSKIIDLYSDYTENKLQVLTFVAIISISISL